MDIFPTSGNTKEENQIAEAYDELAGDYDIHLLSAQWIRDRLWANMDEMFTAGSSILDVTAGTGSDALYLAAHGVNVIAGDISRKMIGQISTKSSNVETRLLDFNLLKDEYFDSKFNGIISTFAGLNTSPDLSSFAASSAKLLQPGGVLFIHLLNRWPLAEMINQLRLIKWRVFARTLTRSQRDINLGGHLIPHYLYSPLNLYHKIFAKQFQLIKVEAYGLLGLSMNRRIRSIETGEQRIASTFPFYLFGTFFSLDMRKR